MAGSDGSGGIVIGISHEAPLAAAYLAGSGLAMAGFAAAHIPHLQAVRLRPEAPELLDSAALAGLA
jgi:hypothetical protein